MHCSHGEDQSLSFIHWLAHEIRHWEDEIDADVASADCALVSIPGGILPTSASIKFPSESA